MASLIDGFNYDVFISYRQKDNKYDGWVTTFVENLKLELEATFKEDLGVYFDLNPHDGLLESNVVSDSLNNKLRCVVFIPVLSHTYCDPKSFAFTNEFKAFVDKASNDRIGLKVKQPNGNVYSRILPVRINELSSDDMDLVESVTGSPVRGIDFIYRTQGVNRPLRQFEDHPQDNLNKIYYRDQINKVAGAIREILQAVRGDRTLPEKRHRDSVRSNERPTYRKKGKLLLTLSTIIAACLLAYIFLFSNLKKNSQDLLDEAISYHDFFGEWQNYSGRLRMITLFQIGDLSREIIEINTGENYYKNTRISNSGRDTITTGIQSGKMFKLINGESLDKIPVRDSLNILIFREHHYWHFGGIMYLKNSGLKLSDKVERTRFFGKRTLMLTFVDDSLTGNNEYLKDIEWNVFLNPENHKVTGYRMKGGYLFKQENQVVCEGEFNHNKLKIPVYKLYYDDKNSIFLVDMFTELNDTEAEVR